MVDRKANMNKQHNPISYKIGTFLAYLAITLATLLATGGGLALLKLLIDYIIS